MAAYAALVSVMQIIHQLERHPSPPISLNKQQLQSLSKTVTSLQEFLEGYDSPFAYSDEPDPLEMRIADAAYAVEDVMESYIVDVIKLRQSTSIHHQLLKRINWNSFINCFRGHNFCQDLEQVMEELDSIRKEESTVQIHQPQRNIIRSSSLIGNNSCVMVGFDDVLLEILDKLTGGPRYRQVIPFTGMGGIGKTTLARNIFGNALIKEYFQIRAWVTISQQYSIRDVICQILCQFMNGYKSSEKSEEELGEELHKYLFGRRYLIIMDDMWSIDVWEKMKIFFVDCNNGSRIIVTTRLTYLTSLMTNSFALNMEFLDEANSWNLFVKTVLGEERVLPLELEKIGMKIVKLCRGLPLSIVVIGGLLEKSLHTQQHWEHVEEKLNSIVHSENDEYCLKILKLSYNHLPAYLKPSFLYMGIFEEDTRIRVSTLIRLWVSEGFLKPGKDKSLETIGRGFLKDLIDRNLILIDELGCTGNIKYIKMHDLLRELCLKEGERERFYHVIGKHSPQGIHKPRRVFYPQRSYNEGVINSMSHVRSLTSQAYGVEVSKFRLLRIFNANSPNGIEYRQPKYCLNVMIHELVNSRYLAFGAAQRNTKVTSSVNLLWNLHTLRVNGKIVLPVQIWKMSQLRHIDSYFGVRLPDPPCGNSVILENLETLQTIRNLKCGDEVVNRIPNIKKLRIRYKKVTESDSHDDYYCLRNVERLCKLESFTIIIRSGVIDQGLMQSLTLPNTLQKLSLQLSDDTFGWEKMLEKVGSSLPHLQKLVLNLGRFTTGKWETVEGQFPNLKLLRLWACGGLKEWIIEESSYFPCLEQLHLHNLMLLEEIPAEIGNVPTLQSIELWGCRESVVKSAKKIVEEQEDLQGDQLSFHVRVRLFNNHEELRSLASPNFSVEF